MDNILSQSKDLNRVTRNDEQKNQELKLLRSGIQILGRAIEETAEEEGIQWLNKCAKSRTLLYDYKYEIAQSIKKV